MMTSSNGNMFRVTDHLCGEFTGDRWIPRTKASDAELWCFLRYNGWANNRKTGYLRRHRSHYDVTVMRNTVDGANENIRYYICHIYVIYIYIYTIVITVIICIIRTHLETLDLISCDDSVHNITVDLSSAFSRDKNVCIFSWQKCVHFLVTKMCAFSRDKNVCIFSVAHWNLFICVQLIICKYWFKQWLGVKRAPSHNLSQWDLIPRCIDASAFPNTFIHRGLVTPYHGIELDQHWLR